jgi:putative oxidoreductase
MHSPNRFRRFSNSPTDPRSAAAELARLRAGATVLRVALGLTMFAHGMLKVVVFGMPGTVAFFVGHGLPAWTAWAVTAAELAGGAALFAGLFVRPVAIAFLPILAGVLATLAPNGFWFDAAGGGGWEFPAVLILGMTAQALLGSGQLALGPWLAHRRATVSAGAEQRLAA